MKLKRIIGFTLAVVMAFTTAGCGSKNRESDSVITANKAAHFYKAEYLEDIPASAVNIMRNCIVGDSFYYCSNGINYDSPMVGCINLLSGESSVIWEKDTRDSREINISGLGADAEGNVYFLQNIRRLTDEAIERYADATEEDIIQYIYDEWGFDSYESAEEYWSSVSSDIGDKPLSEIMAQMAADYEMDYLRENVLVKKDSSGKELFSNTIDLSVDANVSGLSIDGKGNILLAINEYGDDGDKNYVMVLDGEGTAKGNITVSTYLDGLIILHDGSAAYSEMDENMNNTLHRLDTDGMKISDDSIPLTGIGYMMNFAPMSATDFLINNGTDMLRYDTATGKSEKFFSWLDSNIMSSDVRNFSAISDGRIAVFMESYGGNGSTCDLAVLHEISEEEANKVTPINVVCFYSSYALRTAALEFNKKHSDYRISITDYYDFSNTEVEYDDAMDSFVTDCATDRNIDIIMCAGYSQMLDFADKGLFVDIAQYMEGDDKVNRDTIIPAIYNACTYKDKLAGLPANYSVRTLMGKSSVVGDRIGWTVKECLDAYKSTGAREMLPYTTRSEMLKTLVSLNYEEFIDLENATCNFNNQDFQDILELTKLLPEEYVYDDESDEFDNFQSGKTLLANTSLPNFNEPQELKSICGEDISFIGYPNSNGNGALMELGNILGITTNCKEPQTAWEFVREMYLPRELWYGGEYYNGSILKTELDAYFEEAKTWTDRGEMGINGHTVELTTPTDEEINTTRDIIENAVAVQDAVPNSVMNIIAEEAAAYYSGEKLASDVAAIVQSRVDIYLSETR